MATVKTSFTCTLGGDSATAHLSAEIDARSQEDGGFNAADLGKTSGFEPGETIAFLVYMSSDVKVKDTKSLRSSLEDVFGFSFSAHGKTSVTLEETLVFDGGSRSVGVQKPPTEILKTKWIGNDLEEHFQGELSISEKGEIKLPPIPDSMKIRPNDSDSVRKEKLRKITKPGVCVMKYKAEPSVYKFATPTESTMEDYGKPPYEVNIIINGEPDDGEPA